MEKLLEAMRNRDIELVFRMETSYGHGGVPIHRGLCRILDYDRKTISEVSDVEWGEGLVGVSNNLQEKILLQLSIK